MISVTNPLGHTQSITYDPNGNTASITDGNGDLTNYTYDALDRQTQISYADGTQVSFTYDAVGNRLSMVDSQGATNYTYDNLYRPSNITSPNGSLQYTYDAVNRLSISTPAGTTTYDYDEAYQLVQVTDWEGQITAYDYDNAGRLTTTQLPNGVLTTNSYDAANRLISIIHKKETTLLESFSYTLDPVGNRLSMTDADGTTSYTYDALDRLMTVSYPTGTPGTVSYTYDPMGNRLTMTEDSVVTAYVYDEADRLISKTKGTETTLYTWDDDGNLLTKGDQTFIWNKAGKLGAWTDGTNSSSYAYNGDGVRVSQTNNGTTIKYLQDLGAGMATVLREEENGEFIDYFYGMDLISQQDSTSTNYLLTDGLGSTRLLTNEIGDVTGRYVYDIFGAERTYSGTDQTDFTFAGEQVDKTSGLQYLRARYYDPEDGRFLSVDPYPGSLKQTQKNNNYVYVENNPTRKIDPLGTSSQDSTSNKFAGGGEGGSEGRSWEQKEYTLPWTYNFIKTFFSFSKIKVNGITMLKFKHIAKIFGVENNSALKAYFKGAKIASWGKSFVQYKQFAAEVDRKNESGYYGSLDPKDADRRANISKLTKVCQEGIGKMTKWLGWGEAMDETDWLTTNIDAINHKTAMKNQASEYEPTSFDVNWYDTYIAPANGR
jgi:RHS repeat-associated protein